MRKNISYHTRLDCNNTVKVVGGSFSGSFDMETVNRLVNSQFTVRVKNSGRAVFVDGKGNEVSVYVVVDPDTTEAGKLAIAEERKTRAALQAVEDEKQARINELLSNLSDDEVIRRLTE